MSSTQTNSTPPNQNESDSKTITLPSRLPPPTGNLAYDSVQSALHITAIPCARESLLAGIAAGAGIGVIRGFSLTPVKAGNWAVATFAITSIVSWQICQNKIRREREQIASVLEQTPQRRAVVKESEETSSSSPGTTS
ncbi:Cytochrome c oxidase protein 20, mitochondrial [Leucoagaricus sp. SymC.cos]|nr:Cytochrome c oxidase protein 20, mitochondrial [Leucoagaricus sp. SymC.cos]